RRLRPGPREVRFRGPRQPRRGRRRSHGLQLLLRGRARGAGLDRAPAFEGEHAVAAWAAVPGPGRRGDVRACLAARSASLRIRLRARAGGRPARAHREARAADFHRAFAPAARVPAGQAGEGRLRGARARGPESAIPGLDRELRPAARLRSAVLLRDLGRSIPDGRVPSGAVQRGTDGPENPGGGPLAALRAAAAAWDLRWRWTFPSTCSSWRR